MPLKFEIYRDGNRVTHFAPIAAMALGPESVPLPSDITFWDGHLVVNRPDEQPLALGLLWDVKGCGEYQLETTRLQHRTRPYNLNVEFARNRLMRLMQKQEDWNLFDFPKAEKFGLKFREAQGYFAEALGRLHEPVEASKLADQSLEIAVELSEQLAAFHSELLINRRRMTNGFVRHIFGCRIDSTVQAQKYKDIATGNFDYAVLPMRWRQLQPQEQVFDAAATDEWVELLAARRLPIIAGPLIDLSEGEVPDWMYIWENDFDTLRELAYEYVQKVVTRYRKAVTMWNVCAGLHTNAVFPLTFEQIIELTRLLVTQIKTLAPNAKTLVTLTHPFGEYHARARPSVPPMFYAEMVSQAGISFEAFGLEYEMGVPSSGRYARDLFQFSSMLDRFSGLGQPLFLTGLGVPGQGMPDRTDRSDGKLDPSHGGRWHRAWDPETQAEWMAAAYRIALSKPFVESISWATLSDIKPGLPAGGLLDDAFRPKPAFTRLQEMRDQFHSWTKRG